MFYIMYCYCMSCLFVFAIHVVNNKAGKQYRDLIMADVTDAKTGRKRHEHYHG